MASSIPYALDLCKDFFRTHYKDDILNLMKTIDSTTKVKSLPLNYHRLVQYNISLAELLFGRIAKYFFEKLNHALKLVVLELASLNDKEQEELSDGYSTKYDGILFKVKIYNLPWGNTGLVRYKIPNSQDRGMFICFCGTVIRVGSVFVFDATRSFQCEECRSIVSVEKEISTQNVVIKPKHCSMPDCQSTKFKQLKDAESANRYDYREIKVQESLQRMTSNNLPRSFSVTLEHDLVESCKPGDDVAVYGFVQDRWQSSHPGSRGNSSLYLEANNVVVLNAQSTNLSPLAYEQFEAYWANNVRTPLSARNKILASICPQLYGLYLIKLAIGLVLAGGVACSDQDHGIRVRRHSHLLLVGDPGTGKSLFLKYIAKMMPRAVLTTGIGSTSAGLTAVAVRDGPDWVLEAGALVLADEGICCIDEFNTMREHDKTCILEAMEQQTLSIAKGGMCMKLQTRCSIVAGCNPKGLYDKNDPITINVALSSPLLSRFDLILMMLDVENKDWDNVAATYILEGIDLLGHGSTSNPWSITKMRDYFICIKPLEPEMSSNASIIITNYYTLARKAAEETNRRVTVRQLESTVRLAQAHAKLMFRKTVDVIDAIIAVVLMEASLNGCGQLFNGELNTLHTAFSSQPELEYQNLVSLVLNWLGLTELRDLELRRIDEEYDFIDNWTEDVIDQQNKSCTISKKQSSSTPSLIDTSQLKMNSTGGFKMPSSHSTYISSPSNLLSTQINQLKHFDLIRQGGGVKKDTLPSMISSTMTTTISADKLSSTTSLSDNDKNFISTPHDIVSLKLDFPISPIVEHNIMSKVVSSQSIIPKTRTNKNDLVLQHSVSPRDEQINSPEPKRQRTTTIAPATKLKLDFFRKEEKEVKNESFLIQKDDINTDSISTTLVQYEQENIETLLTVAAVQPQLDVKLSTIGDLNEEDFDLNFL
ncbi:unnamed protein product [Didymodactylos carnosus]|uniref:DNA helicase n=1 Tax=Didymodactylos carnosus TaxID=1234261 RepID=A0A814KB65_9BILA|nr:unnamed protein product [Didymodactylos carnosus]CAF1139078.1 unnamed protein product [Didymodactylos carnosus]CAF3819714.1 unnamed protein product [Didymodactylos carnosus]CAF3931650.1 unnamed protein product [Didymodactylos carnosus]